MAAEPGSCLVVLALADQADQAAVLTAPEQLAQARPDKVITAVLLVVLVPIGEVVAEVVLVQSVEMEHLLVVVMAVPD
jgi:hypothetical protein